MTSVAVCVLAAQLPYLNEDNHITMSYHRSTSHVANMSSKMAVLYSSRIINLVQNFANLKKNISPNFTQLMKGVYNNSIVCKWTEMH